MREVMVYKYLAVKVYVVERNQPRLTRTHTTSKFPARTRKIIKHGTQIRMQLTMKTEMP